MCIIPSALFKNLPAFPPYFHSKWNYYSVVHTRDCYWKLWFILDSIYYRELFKSWYGWNNVGNVIMIYYQTGNRYIPSM